MFAGGRAASRVTGTAAHGPTARIGRLTATYAGAIRTEGDLNPETGEISLNLDLNSKTGEKSPDRGVHAAMVGGARRFASTRRRRDCGSGAAGPVSSQAELAAHLLVAPWLRANSPCPPNWAEELVESGDGNERGDVARPDGGEVPQVHRRDGDDPEPLADSDHRSIRAAEPEVGVLAHEA